MKIQRSISRRGLVAAVLLIGVLQFGCSKESSPNVILVSLDTLRADRLGSYGSDLPLSPALDDLASESVVFERAISQCSHTYDSHKSLFLSRYPTRSEEADLYLAEVFSLVGYRTAAFTGGGMVAAELGFDRGFEIYEEHKSGFDRSLPSFRRWLDNLDPGAATPFFVFLHSYDIHTPYNPSPPYDTKFYPDYDGPIKPSETSSLVRQYMGLDPPGSTFAEVEWNDDDRRWLEALYDGGVLEVDDIYIEMLLKMLSESPSWDWDRDVLVFFSDHGEEFFEHGSLGHGVTLFQEMLHVPLLIRLPNGAHGGTRVDTQVRLIDVGPTLLELAGSLVPRTFIGESLMPLVDGPPEDSADRVAISLTVGGLRSIIDPPWKLIFSNPKNVEMLYHLDNDPLETTSVAEDNPEIVKRLRKQLSASLSGVQIVRDEIITEDEVTDPALIEQLRALGYLADPDPSEEPESPPEQP